MPRYASGFAMRPMASSTKGPTKLGSEYTKGQRRQQHPARQPSGSSLPKQVVCCIEGRADKAAFSPSFKGAPVYPAIWPIDPPWTPNRGLIPFRSSGSRPTPRLRCDQDAASARGSAEHDGNATWRGDRPDHYAATPCAQVRPRGAASALRSDARTFLTHFIGSSPDDDRFVFGEVPFARTGDMAVQTNGTKAKGWRQARGTILPMKAAEKMPYRRSR